MPPPPLRTSPSRAQDELRAYTVQDVADRLGLSPKTVVRLIDAGQLTALHARRRGTPVRVTARSLRAYFDAAEERR